MACSGSGERGGPNAGLGKLYLSRQAQSSKLPHGFPGPVAPRTARVPDRPGFSDRVAANRPTAGSSGRPRLRTPRSSTSSRTSSPGSLGAGRADAVRSRAGRPVRRQPHDRQPRAARAAAEGLVERVQGVGTFAAQLHRVSSTLTIRDLHEEIAERGHRHHAEVHIVRAEKRRRRAGAAPRPRRGRHRLPHADRAPRERRGAAVRRPLRQPGLRPRLPERRLHPDHADALPARSRAAVGGAVLDRGQPADAAGGAPAAASPPPSRAWSSSGAPSAAACRSRSRGWSTRARATRSTGTSSHDAPMPALPRSRVCCNRAASTPAWRRVHADDVAPQPWRNGGGQTRELLAWPDAATWQVRVSVADIERDGPFSSFPGVQRWFAVLKGRRRRADDRRRPRTADAQRPAAGVRRRRRARHCRLIDGPTRDLNLMLRGVDGSLTVASDAIDWQPTARAVRTLQRGRRRVRGRRRDASSCRPYSLLWFERAPSSLRFDAQQRPAAATAWWMEAGERRHEHARSGAMRAWQRWRRRSARPALRLATGQRRCLGDGRGRRPAGRGRRAAPGSARTPISPRPRAGVCDRRRTRPRRRAGHARA